jgi:hypothetical protein
VEYPKRGKNGKKRKAVDFCKKSEARFGKILLAVKKRAELQEGIFLLVALPG